MSLELDNEDRPLDTGCIVNGNTRPMGLMAAELDLQCPTTSSMPSGPPGIQQVFTKPLADSDTFRSTTLVSQRAPSWAGK